MPNEPDIEQTKGAEKPQGNQRGEAEDSPECPFAYGTHAQISGLQGKPELNTKYCVSRGVDPRNAQRIQVIISDGSLLSLKPANLTRFELHVECMVTVVGLVTAEGHRYNGKTGEILKRKNLRWVVDLDDEILDKSFLPENLVPLPPLPKLELKRLAVEVLEPAGSAKKHCGAGAAPAAPATQAPKTEDFRRPLCRSELNALTDEQLAVFAKEKNVRVTGCNRPGMLAVLMAEVTFEGDATSSSGPPAADAEKEKEKEKEKEEPAENKPKDAWTKRKEIEEYKASVYKHFRFGFQVGDRWELLKSVALYDDEFGRDTCHYIDCETKSGWRNIIEIVQCGVRRLKVRGTYWNRDSAMLVADKSRQGWLDIASAVNQDTGELMMKLSKPKAGADGSGPGEAANDEESWVFAPKERRQGRLVVHPVHGSGLELIATPHGMRVAKIEELPGQPDLEVGDVITKIQEVELRGRPSGEAVEQAFKGAFTDNACIDIAAINKRAAATK